MIKTFQEISEMNSPFIIAEIGVNFYDIASKMDISVMDAAKKMILEAKKAGCHAAKFQTYKADTIASKNSPAYWDQSEETTNSQYELFKKFDGFGEVEYNELFRFCNDNDILFISTPFDFESADFLNRMMPFYKISSSDLTNLPFIKHIAKKKKPIILSTGAATLGEIETAISTVYATSESEVALMHCVLDYPTDYEDANLLMIKHLQQVFPGLMLGFSDHTRPDESMIVLTTAYQYGAKFIEKHFTLDKSLPGNDHYHAMDVTDCRKFTHNIEMLNKINGEYYKKPLPCEKESRKQARRSIIAKRDIAIGEILTDDQLTYKRPGTGISPSLMDLVIGRTVTKPIKEDELISWEKI